MDPETSGTWYKGDPVILTVNDFVSPTSPNVSVEGSTTTVNSGGIVTQAKQVELGDPTLVTVLGYVTSICSPSSNERAKDG